MHNNNFLDQKVFTLLCSAGEKYNITMKYFFALLVSGNHSNSFLEKIFKNVSEEQKEKIINFYANYVSEYEANEDNLCNEEGTNWEECFIKVITFVHKVVNAQNNAYLNKENLADADTLIPLSIISDHQNEFFSILKDVFLNTTNKFKDNTWEKVIYDIYTLTIDDTIKEQGDFSMASFMKYDCTKYKDSKFSFDKESFFKVFKEEFEILDLLFFKKQIKSPVLLSYDDNEQKDLFLNKFSETHMDSSIYILRTERIVNEFLSGNIDRDIDELAEKNKNKNIIVVLEDVEKFMITIKDSEMDLFLISIFEKFVSKIEDMELNILLFVKNSSIAFKSKDFNNKIRNRCKNINISYLKISELEKHTILKEKSLALFNKHKKDNSNFEKYFNDAINETQNGFTIKKFLDHFENKILEKNIQKFEFESNEIEEYNKFSVDSVKNLEKQLKSSIFNQNEAIDKLVNNVYLAFSGFREKTRPYGCFMFAGTTGVGKTEMAKLLAKNLNMNLARFDMSEYYDKHTMSKLIGSPQGYVGYEDGGILFNELKNKPRSVILFDEIEKADPSIYNLFLQIMDNGEMKTPKGEIINFRESFVIFTTNEGTEKIEINAIGFNSDKNNRNGKYNPDDIKSKFRPEFRNRLDDVIVFNALNKDVVISIVNKELSVINERIKNKNIKISLSDKALSYVVDSSFDQKMGARPIKQYIEKNILSVVARNNINKGMLKNYDVIVDFKEKELEFSYENK